MLSGHGVLVTPRSNATAGLLILCSVLFGPFRSEAAEPTLCQGERPTIVGPNAGPGRIIGTGGRDVVVTEGARSVRTGAGDDLVCVTDPGRSRGTAFLRTDAGDDSVVVSDRSARTLRVGLGPGVDRFRGGPGNDEVVADQDQPSTEPDTSRDLIDTGGGNDTVNSRQGVDGTSDVVRLGPGEDSVLLPAAGTRPGSDVDGGPGHDDLLGLTDVAGVLAIDTTRGRGTRDGSPWLRFSGMEGFVVYPRDSLDFMGSGRDEELETNASADADMGVEPTPSACRPTSPAPRRARWWGERARTSSVSRPSTTSTSISPLAPRLWDLSRRGRPGSSVPSCWPSEVTTASPSSAPRVTTSSGPSRAAARPSTGGAALIASPSSAKAARAALALTWRVPVGSAVVQELTCCSVPALTTC